MEEQDFDSNSEAIAKGVDLLDHGVTDFSSWSREMLGQFGEPIRSHLQTVWDSAQARRRQAMNCGNLLAVSQALREKWPQRDIIIAADNDQFNDGNRGLDVVKTQIEAAAMPPPESCEPKSPPARGPERGTPPPSRKLHRAMLVTFRALILVALLLSGGIWSRKRQTFEHRPAGGIDLRPDPAQAASVSTQNVTLPTEEGFGAVKARAEKGDVQAQYNLGKLYAHGTGVQQDFQEAVRWYRKAADQGDARAQNNLGVCYAKGQGVQQDHGEAVRWYRKAADQGDARAQNNLGVCYAKGQGVQQDHGEAVKLYRKAAEQGNEVALYQLGCFYRDGQGVPRDYQEAIKWFQKAKEKGYGGAQEDLAFCYANLGVAYYKGEVVSKDYAEAVKCWREAAGQGDTHVQVWLGDSYYNGQGVERDYAEAAKWYREAADRGDAVAQYSLGECYRERRRQGQGVEGGLTEAAKWYRRAAHQGLARAQFTLGAYYQTGAGVPQSDVEAYKWLSLAAAQGLQSAAQLRDLFSDRMARAEITEAQRLAAAFVAQKESPSAADTWAASALPPATGSDEKGSGTAFFVSEDGYLLSNFHVVEGASIVKVRPQQGSILSGKVVRIDRVNDIAIIKVSGSFRTLPLATDREAKLGAPIFTIGYPNIDLQGLEPKFTKGEISSPYGPQDDPRYFQISAPVQPGNSGGPLVNDLGNVIGIVTARLSDTAALETSGALPQNVNYATKISYAVTLLESVPGLAVKLKPPHPADQRSFEERVQEARDAVALVLVY